MKNLCDFSLKKILLCVVTVVCLSVSVVHADKTIEITGNGSRFILSAGAKLYVINSYSNNISVVDSATDTVINTISVGALPTYPILVGTKLYVGNYDDATVSVIDTVTDTVITTINTPHGNSAYNFVPIGTKL
jgi:YVTN family beta-propeller protein